VSKLHLVAGLRVFGPALALDRRPSDPALLPWALAMYLVFAALHTVFPLVLERQAPRLRRPRGGASCSRPLRSY